MSVKPFVSDQIIQLQIDRLENELNGDKNPREIRRITRKFEELMTAWLGDENRGPGDVKEAEELLKRLEKKRGSASGKHKTAEWEKMVAIVRWALDPTVESVEAIPE